MNKEKITSLVGIKTISMIILFLWHSPLSNPPIDLGARMCEIMFICAGFLVSYNHFDENIPLTFDYAKNYLLSKIIKIWPIHFIAFLLVAYLNAVVEPQTFFTLKNLFNAVVNLSFLQAWSTDCFSFNGAAWFISALLFCYFMSPLLLSIMKRNNKTLLLLFSITIRISLELASINGDSVFELNFHVSPVIRCIEFFMGMLLFPIFIKLKHRLKPANTIHTVLLTLVEILTLSVYIFLLLRFNEIWIRGFFVMFSCVLILVFSFNAGFVSKFLSLAPFCWFSKIQMEFYILHQAIIFFLDSLYISFPVLSQQLVTLLYFTIILSAAILYKVCLSKGCTKLMTALLKPGK